jgi:hypothetical protein
MSIFAGGLANLADNLAAGADDLADLLFRNRELGDARRLVGHRLAGAGDRLAHLAKDVQTAVLRLAECNPHDLFGDRGDLDVHLQRGDAGIGACHLEVHVAEVILVAQDVGQHREALAFLDEAHGNARHRLRQRHARVHH